MALFIVLLAPGLTAQTTRASGPARSGTCGLPRATALPGLTSSLRLPDGSPAAGAHVALTLTHLGYLRKPTPDIVLARTTVAPDGCFSLEPGRLSADALQISRQKGGLLTAWVVAALPAGGNRMWTAVHGQQLTVSGEAITSAGQPLSLTASNVPRATVTDPSFCGTSDVDTPEKHATTAAEMHAWDDMTATFTYQTTGETDIDTGVSENSGGPWSLGVAARMQSGQSYGSATTTTVGPTQTDPALQVPFGREMQPYQEWHHQLVNDCGAGALSGFPVSYYTVSPQRFIGYMNLGPDHSNMDGPQQYLNNNDPGDTNTWMANYSPGQTFTKVNGTTQRYSAAATAFGFTAGAESQYSSNFNINWVMGHKYGHNQYHLWGSDHQPVPYAQSVYAYSGPQPFVTAPDCSTGSGSSGGGFNEVGVLRVWGDATGPYGTGQEVVTTGCDAWNGQGAGRQVVSSTVAKAVVYRDATRHGSFWVKTDVGPGGNTLNPTGSTIWYDVNTIDVGYTGHTQQGGYASYQCSDTRTVNNNITNIINTVINGIASIFGGSGPMNVGSVAINPMGQVVAATDGIQGRGNPIPVDGNNIAGPFSVGRLDNRANNSPKESAVCLSDALGQRGNEAPLTLI